MSKLLEKFILNRISDNLMTNPNQFGFKPKHNTEMCIFALKEAILKYRALNSNVYSCFLDASKAFDLCFTGLFIHGMLPPSMISVVLFPIVKDKRASVCSRPHQITGLLL